MELANDLALTSAKVFEPPAPISVLYPKSALPYFTDNEGVGTLLQNDGDPRRIAVQHYWQQMVRLYATPPPPTKIGDRVLELATEAVANAEWRITSIDIAAQKTRDAITHLSEVMPCELASYISHHSDRLPAKLGLTHLNNSLRAAKKDERVRKAHLGAFMVGQKLNHLKNILRGCGASSSEISFELEAAFERTIEAFNSLSETIEAAKAKNAQ